MNRREGERARTLNSVVTERLVLKGRRQAGGPAALEGLAGSWSPVQNFGLDLQPGARGGQSRDWKRGERQKQAGERSPQPLALLLSEPLLSM